MTNQIIIKKSRYHHIIQPLMFAILGLIIFMIAYSGSVDNSQLSILRIIPLGPTKLWFYGFTILSILALIVSTTFYFKSQNGFIMDTNNIVYNDVSISIGDIKSIRSSLNENKQPILIIEYYKSYSSDPNDKSMYRINVEISQLDFDKKESLKHRIMEFVSSNNIKNNIEFN